jgi:hypothetical protein
MKIVVSSLEVLNASKRVSEARKIEFHPML